MGYKRVSIKQAIDFHGHLGPYLILGILAGELAQRKLKAKRYFGIEVKVWGASSKPKSCLIDGLQLSTGATYGKGNIRRFNGNKIKILISDSSNKAHVLIMLKNRLIECLKDLKGHEDSEGFARKLYKLKPMDIFEFKAEN